MGGTNRRPSTVAPAVSDDHNIKRRCEQAPRDPFQLVVVANAVPYLIPTPEGGRRLPWRLLPFLLPLAVVSPSSSRPCQGGEMKISMRQCSRFELARLPRDCRRQSRGDDSVQDPVTMLRPGAIEDSKPRCSERTFRAIKPLVVSFAESRASGLEEPPELLQLGGPQRSPDLLPERLAIPRRRVRQVVRDEDANGPGRQSAQQLGVTLEEHAKVRRQRSCRKVEKHVRPAILANADRQLVGEPPHSLPSLGRERQRGQIRHRNAPRRREVRDLLSLSRQPLQIALANHRIEHH